MRLIAVSGYAQPEDVKKPMEAGFDPGEIDRLLGKDESPTTLGS
jgi:hypothetical protein